MQVTLLNLDASRDRLASFQAVNRHLSDLRRSAAVDGRAVPRQALRESRTLEGEMPGYTNGALGCALSHLALWDQAARERRIITVAEDDAILHHRFEELAQSVIATLPADWDMILWGWNFDSILAFDLMPGVSSCVGVFNQETLRSNTGAYQAMPLSPVAYRLQRAFGTVCLSVSPSGAERLLRHCLPIRPMDVYYPLLNRTIPNLGIDNMMNDLYPRMKAYVSFPPLVITPNERAISTVQTRS